MFLDSQKTATRTSNMFTMLRCSWSAAAFNASLKLGDTLKFSVSLFTSSNFMAPRRCLCICVMVSKLWCRARTILHAKCLMAKLVAWTVCTSSTTSDCWSRSGMFCQRRPKLFTIGNRRVRPRRPDSTKRLPGSWGDSYRESSSTGLGSTLSSCDLRHFIIVLSINLFHPLEDARDDAMTFTSQILG